MYHRCPTRRVAVVPFVIFLIAASFASARAQSSVFNTPSPDVMTEKMTYLEFDFFAHPDRLADGGYQSYGVSAVYGLRKNLEVGANIYYTRAGEPMPAEVQPNLKWQFYANEETGVSAAAGAIAVIPIIQREGTDTFGMAYAVAGKKIKRKYGPRLSTGAYTLVAAGRDAGTKRGAFFAYDQPLTKRLNFVADWYTGKNYFGYAAAGAGLTLTPNSYLYAGYSFGNQGRKNNWLGIYYGVTF